MLKSLIRLVGILLGVLVRWQDGLLSSGTASPDQRCHVSNVRAVRCTTSFQDFFLVFSFPSCFPQAARFVCQKLELALNFAGRPLSSRPLRQTSLPRRATSQAQPPVQKSIQDVTNTESKSAIRQVSLRRTLQCTFVSRRAMPLLCGPRGPRSTSLKFMLGKRHYFSTLFEVT